MLNLHPPFRMAEPADAEAIARLGTHSAPPAGTDTVVADEGGLVTAALSGRVDGETWAIELLTIAPDRIADLGRRLLAVADALAADEGLAAVMLRPHALQGDVRGLLDEEGFRPDEGGLWSRPVVPQG